MGTRRAYWFKAPIVAIALGAVTCSQDVWTETSQGEPAAGPVKSASGPEDAPRGGMPPAPFAIPAPVAELEPPADEPQAAPGRAFALALEAAASGDLARARRLASASVTSGGRGRGLLARLSSRASDPPAAIHWLQRAAAEEGIDPADVASDADFATTRADSRWPALRDYLEHASAYWAVHGKPASRVVGPCRARRGSPTAIVALHDSGGDPTSFLSDPAYERRARRLGACFVAVSGTIPLGPMAYRWSPEPDANARHVAMSLAGIRDGTAVPEHNLVLLGFSEGAQVALETAVRDPTTYRGAMAFSPRGIAWRLDEVTPSDATAHQRHVIAVGSFDSFQAVGTSYVDARLLRALGAEVEVHTAWLSMRHALPPDFDIQLPHWLDHLLGGTGARPRSSTLPAATD